MKLTIGEFCKYVDSDLNGLIYELQEDTSRTNSDNEIQAWEGSFPCVSRMLTLAIEKQPAIADAQISTVDIVPEYKLPAASAWCDLVLLGMKGQQAAAVIIELKNWLRESVNEPGNAEGLIIHKGGEYNHPSDQVKGYTEYCRHFHSAVQDYEANVDGCVYFTQPVDVTPIVKAPNNKLTEEYPVFNIEMEDQLSTYIVEHIDGSNEEFATAFVKGYYKQNRNILMQVAENFSESDASPFILLDQQRHGFNKVMDSISKRLKDGQKQVVIVDGPPGSGKSAIAITLWFESILKYKNPEDIPGNIVMVTTSQSQEHNWSDIFDRYGKKYHAHDLIVKASSFKPTSRNIDKSYYESLLHSKLKADVFRKLTNALMTNGETVNYRPNLYFLSIVDEAHALVNPCAPQFHGFALGWNNMFGPQAYHIINESQISVFFTDGEQSFRDQETTSYQDIVNYANELGAQVLPVSLRGMQFRCAGSVDYVSWVDHMLDDNPLLNAHKWLDKFSATVVDSPFKMDEYLRKKCDKDKHNVRILAPYSVAWVSKVGLDERHEAENTAYDFSITTDDGRLYQKFWNNPKSYSIFVQGREGSLMHDDPLCEVGCPYVVRGFDFDDIGLIWLDDLVWRTDHWEVSFSKSFETANSSTRAAARKLAEKKYGRGVDYVPVHMPADGETPDAIGIFFKTVFQARRILFTRAMKSVCIYVHDPETRKHLCDMLK